MLYFRLTWNELETALGIGIICLPLFLVLVPNIEASKTEVMFGTACWDIRKLAESQNENWPTVGVEDKHAANTTEELPEVDPWGTPYRFEKLENDQIRAVSAGPNQTFGVSGFDMDDIYSDMPTSPIEVIHARKSRQILISVLVPFVAWAIACTLVIRYRRRSANG